MSLLTLQNGGDCLFIGQISRILDKNNGKHGKNMITIQSVLVEYEDREGEKVYANSGLFFADRYVLMTSNILAPLLAKQKNRVRVLEAGRLLNPNVLLKFPPRINVVITDEGRNVQYKRGFLSAMFVNEALRRSCEIILRDWTVDHQETDHQFKELLSLFFIAEIAPAEKDHDHLTGRLREIWAKAKTLRAEVGREILIESVPFGNRNFLKSYSRGIVSNVTGEDDCVILTDASTAPGSEGGPIFAVERRNNFAVEQKKAVPFGIVISCLCWWKGEWTGLTLGASISTLLRPLIKNEVTINFREERSEIRDISEVLENSLVQIISGTSWGTAILLAENIFVTNSHVIESDDGVILRWKAKEIKASVIFKTETTKAYDLAIISGRETTQLKPANVSLDRLRIGERVFAAGFPLFESHLNPRPTLTSGHVSQVSPFMMRTTCPVLPGSSGGAILRPNGSLVGVIVCNTKLTDGESPAYPTINLAIPIAAIYGIVMEFLKTEDVSALHKLEIQDASANKQWNLSNCKL